MCIRERRPARLLGDASIEVAFLDTEGGTVELIGQTSESSSLETGASQQAGSVANVHLAFTVQNLAAFEAHCRSNGIGVRQLADVAGVVHAIHVQDPDGVTIEVSELR